MKNQSFWHCVARMIKQKAAHNTKNERKEHMWWMQFAVVNSIYGNGLKIAKVIWCLFKAASHETQAKIDKKKMKTSRMSVYLRIFSRIDEWNKRTWDFVRRWDDSQNGLASITFFCRFPISMSHHRVADCPNRCACDAKRSKHDCHNESIHLVG